MTKLKLHDEEVKHAIRWFARQPESEPFFAALQAVLEDIAGNVDASALHRHDERRKFAADLIAMAEAEKRDGPEGIEPERRNGPRAQQRRSRRHGPAGRA